MENLLIRKRSSCPRVCSRTGKSWRVANRRARDEFSQLNPAPYLSRRLFRSIYDENNCKNRMNFRRNCAHDVQCVEMRWTLFCWTIDGEKLIVDDARVDKTRVFLPSGCLANERYTRNVFRCFSRANKLLPFSVARRPCWSCRDSICPSATNHPSFRSLLILRFRG